MNTNKTLTVNSDKIIQAAKQCPEAAKVLKTIFPEAFKDEGFDIRKLVLEGSCANLFTNEKAVAAGFDDNQFMQLRTDGPHAGKGFWLNNKYNWEIKAYGDILTLVPSRKDGIS